MERIFKLLLPSLAWMWRVTRVSGVRDVLLPFIGLACQRGWIECVYRRSSAAIARRIKCAMV